MTEFTIGADAACSDGPCGKVSRLIVEPGTEAVTHLVVKPGHHGGPSRLVPVGLVDAAAGGIRLRCTRAEFGGLDPAEETEFLPAAGGMPGQDPGASVMRGLYIWHLNVASVPPDGGAQVSTHDTVPAGEVDVRRGESVWATDGEIGRILGLAVDPVSEHVTHVLLEEGHLWGRRQVAIPVSAVTRVGDIIRLNISKHDVENLQPVELARG